MAILLKHFLQNRRNTALKQLTWKQNTTTFLSSFPSLFTFLLYCWTVKNLVPLTDMTREVTVKILEFQATSRPKNLTPLAYKTALP